MREPRPSTPPHGRPRQLHEGRHAAPPTRSPAPTSTSTTTFLPEFPPGDVTAGLDWATADHAVAIVDNRGMITEQFLIDATGAGLRELVRRLRRAGVEEIEDQTRDRHARAPHGELRDRRVGNYVIANPS